MVFGDRIEWSGGIGTMEQLFKSLHDWDGSSDVILVGADQDGNPMVKVCHAESLHRILAEYREFVDTHQLTLETTSTANHLIVMARWVEKRGVGT